MSGQVVRVLIVDDHPMVRRGLRLFLETSDDMEVVGEAENGRVAVELAEQLKPDVILMDLVMPEMDGVLAIREIRSLQLETQILVLTSFSSDDKIFPAVKAGALGYLLKDTDADELAEAIRHAATGYATLSPVVASRLVRQFKSESEPTTPIEPLTQREVEVLELVGRGLTNEQIGEQLFVSDATVRTHVSHILGKLGLANRTQAALWALCRGVLTLDDVGRLGR